jgi:predicted Zn finger-like uncharacterized protein
MKVQCSKCESKYNIKDEKIPDAGTKVKCPKCQNVISVMKPEPEISVISAAELLVADNSENEVHSDIKKCPFCAEDIKVDAIKCKHCGELLDESIKGNNSPEPIQKKIPEKSLIKSIRKKYSEITPVKMLLIGIVLIGLVLLYQFTIGAQRREAWNRHMDEMSQKSVEEMTRMSIEAAKRAVGEITD